MEIAWGLNRIHRKEVLLEELPRDAQVVGRPVHHKVRLMVHKHPPHTNHNRDDRARQQQ
jgi:hypothetical protein